MAYKVKIQTINEGRPTSVIPSMIRHLSQILINQSTLPSTTNHPDQPREKGYQTGMNDLEFQQHCINKLIIINIIINNQSLL